MRFFLFFGLSGLAVSLLAQVPFANVIQTPMLLNPAFSGNKNKHRVILAVNQNKADSYRNMAYHVSYDNFSKQIRLGYGAYVLHGTHSSYFAKEDRTLQKAYFRHDALSQTHPDRRINNKLGFSMASKHNLDLGTGSKKTKATFSPSLSISGSENYSEYYGGFKVLQKQSSDSLNSRDSLSYTHQTVVEGGLGAVLGLKYNTARFMLMYSFGYEWEKVREENYVWKTAPLGAFIEFETQKVMHKRSYGNRIAEHRLSIGMSFPKDPDADYGITIVGSMGVKKYRVSFRQDNDHVPLNTNVAYKNSIPFVSQLHTGVAFRYKKILFNTNYTKYDLYETYGVGLGIQTSYYKLMGTYFPKLKGLASTLELSLGVFI